MNVETKTVGSTAWVAAAAAAAASAGSTGAMAADLSIKAPTAPAVPTWQGLYVGGSVGASWLNSVLDDSGTAFGSYYGSVPGSRQTANGLGAIAGLDIGYNWQDRNFVYGVEADISWVSGNKASSTSSSGSYYTNVKSTQVNGLATFRGRFGLDFNGTMPYLTAGFALGNVKSSNSVAYLGAPVFTQSKTSWQPGVVLGGGIEHQFTSHWSLKGEVLWVGLKDTSSQTFGYGLGSTQFSNSMVIGRVGLNYRF